MSILAWLARCGSGGKDPEVAPASAPIPGADLASLLQYFPIGRRVRYYPEYQRDIKLDTVILGFEVDQEQIFSAHAFRSEPGIDGAPRLRLADRGPPQGLDEVRRVRLIVPHQERTELDFVGSQSASPAQLKESRASDFRRGNAITLFRKTERSGSVHLETEVDRVFVIREGYHANLRAVLLEPDLGTLQCVDQRRCHRIETQLPAGLADATQETLRECVIEDFSGRFLRLAIRGSEDYTSALAVRQSVLLKVPAGEAGAMFVLKGLVHRKEPTHVVVALTGIRKNRRFQPLELVDELELKTSLLHHPATLRAQTDRHSGK